MRSAAGSMTPFASLRRYPSSNQRLHKRTERRSGHAKDFETQFQRWMNESRPRHQMLKGANHAPEAARIVAAVGIFACAAASAGLSPAAPVARLSTWAFTAPWDARSDSSLRANAARIDVAVTGWIQLDSATGQPTQLYPDDPTPARRGTPRLALVTSWHATRFHPEMIRRVAGNRGALSLAASRTAHLLTQGGYDGMVLDLEGQRAADLPLTQRVVSAFADSARRHGAHVIAFALPATDTAAYPARAFVPLADYLVVMLYDEHWSTSAPGPITEPIWVRRALAQRISDVGAEHIVAALPVYSYQWRTTQPATTLSFNDARRVAAQANVELTRDPTSQALHAVQPGNWELWMSDATQLSALLPEVTSLGVSRVGLWRLGLEDPGVWPAIRR